MNNQIRTWILLTVSSLVIIALCNYYWGRNGLLWSFAILFTTHSLFFFMGELKIKNHFQSTPIEGRDPWSIYEMVGGLSQKFRISTPEIYLIDIPHCQAFALNSGLGRSEIYLTQGLIQLLNKEELKSIVALQLANIKSKNIQAYTLMGSLAALFLYFSYKMDAFFSWLISKKSHQTVVENQGGLSTWIVANGLSFLFRTVFNKNDSLKIDKDAAQFVNNSDALASALLKIDSYSKTLPLRVPLHFTHYFVVNPQHRGRFRHCFETQPSVTQRINNLVGHFPL